MKRLATYVKAKQAFGLDKVRGQLKSCEDEERLLSSRCHCPPYYSNIKPSHKVGYLNSIGSPLDWLKVPSEDNFLLRTLHKATESKFYTNGFR